MAGLSDFNKRMIKKGFDASAAAGQESLEELQQLGPAFWIDQTMGCYAHWREVPKAVADAENLAANREEAEQYLAGMMGMM